jgi:hypothetical protein
VQPLAADFWQQTQNGNGMTDHLRYKLLLFDKNANALDQTFSLALKSDILRFTLGGIPQDVGTLRSLIYTVETATGVFKSLQLNVNGVTFSSALDTLTAFLAFDPAGVKIAEDGEVKITLIGDKAYKWSNTIVSGMLYVAGKRYTANVSGTWTEIVNPLSYVAEYNVNQAGDGFVTNLTSCTGSGYFTWNNALNINISGYHLPSNQEWFGIVPQAPGYVRFNATTSYDNITENVIVQGDPITMTSDFRTPKSPSLTSYALRYKGTDMVSAWKYEYVSNSNNTHLKITSRIVAPSVTINDIANNAFWSTNTGNDVVRYFPASGYFKLSEAKQNINIAGYHLPSIEEWSSIVPYNHNLVVFNSTSTTNQSVYETVTVQGESISMSSDYRAMANSNITYALRYKGTDMVSAWRYEYKNHNTSTCHLMITSRNVASTVTIDNIADEPGFWNNITINGNDVIRYFPASGQSTGVGQNTTGLFWSSTGSSQGQYLLFNNAKAASNNTSAQSNKYTVRLFVPGDNNAAQPD